MPTLIVFAVCFCCGFILGWGIWAKTSDDGPDKWEFPWQTIERWSQEKAERSRKSTANKMNQRKNAEMEGTLRIVEKLDEAGDPHYIVQEFRLGLWSSHAGHRNWYPYILDTPVPEYFTTPLLRDYHLDCSEAKPFDTPELAQAAANEKFDDEITAQKLAEAVLRRSAYTKVVGTFRPGGTT